MGRSLAERVGTKTHANSLKTAACRGYVRVCQILSKWGIFGRFSFGMSEPGYFSRAITAAHGYCELHMWQAAWDELESLHAEDRAHPDVLRLRLGIFVGLQRWESAAVLAESLAPAGWKEAFVMESYAIRRSRSLAEALEFLNRGAELLQEDPLFWFNRACYVCQLGDLEAAKISLSHPFQLNTDLRALSLEEADLLPLWDSLATERPAPL